MTRAPNKANLLIFTVLCFLVWGILSLVLSLQLSHELAISWPQAFFRIASVWVVWPVFAPLLYLLTRSLPLNLTNWIRALPAHLALASCALFLAVLIHSYQPSLRPPRRTEPGGGAADGRSRWAHSGRTPLDVFLSQ